MAEVASITISAGSRGKELASSLDCVCNLGIPTLSAMVATSWLVEEFTRPLRSHDFLLRVPFSCQVKYCG
jgi:hypothetical protein